jgi:hypothetical protein
MIKQTTRQEKSGEELRTITTKKERYGKDQNEIDGNEEKKRKEG